MTQAVVDLSSARRLPATEPPEATGFSSREVPCWRGVSHEKAFAFAPALGVLLVLSADGTRPSLAAFVFALTLTLMLGVSAFNHRARYAPRWKPWLRRLDHTTVNLFLAGTWTSFALVLFDSWLVPALAIVVVGGAVVASAVTILWVDAPGWIPAGIALAAGWSAALLIPVLAASAGVGAASLFLAGGLFYTAGAVVYALRRPNPLPESIGYHEVFHALVIGGAACHYLVHALFVVPLAS